jgi:hypothetical protein
MDIADTPAAATPAMSPTWASIFEGKIDAQGPVQDRRRRQAKIRRACHDRHVGRERGRGGRSRYFCIWFNAKGNEKSGHYPAATLVFAEETQAP